MLERLKNTQFNFIFLGISAAMPSFALGIPFGLWLLSAGVTKQTLGLVTVSSIIVASVSYTHLTLPTTPYV